MQPVRAIPDFALFGETAPFPDVVHCERVSARAPVHGWNIAPHRHTQMVQIMHIEAGAVSGRVDGAQIALRDGTVLFVPALAAHTYTFQPGTSGSVVSIPLVLLRGLGADQTRLREALARPISAPAPAKLGALIAMLAETLDGTGPFRTAQAVALSHALLVAVAELAPSAVAQSRPADARLARFDALIAEHAAQGWGPRDYAEALALTTGHLSRLCRAARGYGAGAYIEHAVMEEACRLLAFTQVPVAEVGYRLGYGDPSYFSKRFRAARGETPSTYRARFVSAQ